MTRPSALAPGRPEVPPPGNAPDAENGRSDGSRHTRSVVAEGFGGLDVLSIVEESAASPGPHEVRIRVAGATVSPIDVSTRSGRLAEAGLMVPGDRVGRRVLAPGALQANLLAERHLARFTASGGAGVALRFGAFYGPHDEFSRELIGAALRSRGMVVGAPDAWTSAVHTDDVGPALLVALTAPAGVYDVVDDEPLRRRDLLAVLAEAAGIARLRPLPSSTVPAAAAPVRALARSQRVSAARFRALGWQPAVPSRRGAGRAEAREAGSSPRARAR